MSRFRIVLGALLAGFVVFSVWVVAQIGLVPLFEYVLGHLAGLQVGLDLVLALVAGSVLIAEDARRRGKSAAGWIVLTFCTGSPGLLAYLVARGR